MKSQEEIIDPTFIAEGMKSLFLSKCMWEKCPNSGPSYKHENDNIHAKRITVQPKTFPLLSYLENFKSYLPLIELPESVKDIMMRF